MSEQKYVLHLTEKQAQVIVNALDLYSRIGMGQLKEVAHILRLNPNSSDNTSDILNDIYNELIDLSKLWIGGSGYYGIFSDKISDVFRTAWDIQQVIRHRLAWDRNPEGGIFVNFDKPINTSKEEFPKIEHEKEI
jgi:hypothetical protein